MISNANIRGAMRLSIALLYLAAGMVHLRSPAPFVAITPDWVPYKDNVIFFTGCCEIAGALGLLIPPFRKIAGMALALYAVCVFPANIKHALDHIVLPGVPDTWWYHAPRFMAQPLLIWATLYCVGLIDWPFRARLARQD